MVQVRQHSEHEVDVESIAGHEGVAGHVRHAVGVRVVYLLLGVVGGEPADLVAVLAAPPAVSGLLEDHDPAPLD